MVASFRAVRDPGASLSIFLGVLKIMVSSIALLSRFVAEIGALMI